ncbi:MAG: hypothetical protein H7X95_08520, partial [Deltaproteobacteria bacterium]|nr:hypothetical protein [Deltaproteobacteria bacterium]
MLFSAVFVGAPMLMTPAGCYSPSIEDGKLLCGPGQTCPDGFACLPTTGRCHKTGGSDASRAEVNVDRLPEARPPDTNPGGDGGSCVVKPGIAGCTVQNDLTCDPVCQTACCAGQKCTAMNTGTSPGGAATLGCGPVLTPQRGLGDTCDPVNAGTAQRSDNCAPGLTCIEGNNGSICFKLCRGDADCNPGTKCEQRAVEAAAGSYVASVCGLPKTPCDPTFNPLSGCPSPRICYL